MYHGDRFLLHTKGVRFGHLHVAFKFQETKELLACRIQIPRNIYTLVPAWNP